MHTTTLVIGGCRSGKSGHALTMGNAIAGDKHIFVATCTPHDEEMAERVRRHQQERGRHWQTIETPIDLVGTICEHGPHADVVLIDCLTLWVTNLMMAPYAEEEIVKHMEALANTICDPPCPLILVSNEVGTGIVPENELARRFRDLTGWCNQKLAAVCDEVIWMVAGIPTTIKTNG